MYIFNEYELIEDMLDTHQKPDELSTTYLITLLSKYFCNLYDNIRKLEERIKEELQQFNIYKYQEYLYAKKINEICTDMFSDESKRNFKIIEYVPIYQSDIEVINKLDDDKKKKLMFTLIANARYMNKDGWINKKDTDAITEVFKQSNITGSMKYKFGLLHQLYKDGYINLAKSNTNMNVQITNFEHDDKIVYKVNSFKYLGNQYIGNFKPGYMMCVNCGKIVRNTGNRKMYCRKCAEEITKEKTRERVKLFREK